MGTGKGTGKSMRKLCQNYPFATYPCYPAGHLQECFLGNPVSAFGVLFGNSQKVPRRLPSCPRGCPENWECPRECSQEFLSSFFPKEKHSWEHSLGCSQFSRHSQGHSPGHFLVIPTKHSESTRRSTFVDSPKSTPVNGQQNLKLTLKECPKIISHKISLQGTRWSDSRNRFEANTILAQMMADDFNFSLVGNSERPLQRQMQMGNSKVI